MKAKSTLLANICAGLVALPAFAFDDQKIIEKCDEDWGTDFEMVAYCREEQRKSGASWDRIVERAASGSEAAAIVKHCLEQWETDYEMLVYCNGEQHAALVALAQAPDGVPGETADVIMQKCVGDWGVDFEMVLYCRDEQVKAWRGLQ